MDAFIEAEPNMSDTLVARLKSFLEYETKSCSMDFGCVTPEYVQRMLGGEYSIDEIRDALKICLKDFYERQGIS